MATTHSTQQQEPQKDGFCPPEKGFLFHWVFKVHDLKKSLNFFKHVMGMHVIRHDENDERCKITCNGDYDSAWSKTMVGWGPEESSFVLELIYNYALGDKKYKLGNDLQSISIIDTGGHITQRLQKAGHKLNNCICDDRVKIVTDPDGHIWRLVPDTVVKELAGRTERFLMVSLQVPDPEAAARWYRNMLGLKDSKLGCQANDNSVVLGYDRDQCQLEFVALKDDSVDHGEAVGRLALGPLDNDSEEDIKRVQEQIQRSNDMSMVKHEMTKLSGDEKEYIAVFFDPWGNELCWLNGIAFKRHVKKAEEEAQQTKSQAKGDKDTLETQLDEGLIDWGKRADRQLQQNASDDLSRVSLAEKIEKSEDLESGGQEQRQQQLRRETQQELDVNPEKPRDVEKLLEREKQSSGAALAEQAAGHHQPQEKGQQQQQQQRQRKLSGSRSRRTSQHEAEEEEPFVNPPKYLARRMSSGGMSDQLGEFEGSVLLIPSLKVWNLMVKERELVIALFVDSNSEINRFVRGQFGKLADAHSVVGCRFALVDCRDLGRKCGSDVARDCCAQAIMQQHDLKECDVPLVAFLRNGHLVDQISLAHRHLDTDPAKRYSGGLVDREVLHELISKVAVLTHGR